MHGDLFLKIPANTWAGGGNGSLALIDEVSRRRAGSRPTAGRFPLGPPRVKHPMPGPQKPRRISGGVWVFGAFLR